MRWIERQWYQKTLFSRLLLPLTVLYCAVVRLRRWLYRFGALRTIHLPAPVIVVGNITVGGTGKTPLVIWLANFLKQTGYRPGIVTRGYGGRTRSWPQTVLGDSDPDEVGEEPVLLARRSGCPVMADPNRVRAARSLIHHQNCDLIISDDGLQHLKLGRNIEIAIIDGQRQFGNGYCLPAGPLREPVQRLKDVDLVITHGRTLVGEWGMLLIESGFKRLGSDELQVSTSDFRARTVHAVAGIGHPSRFFEHLTKLGLHVIEHPFPDHHRFRSKDICFTDGYDVVMTEKDAVKCERFATGREWYLVVDAQPDQRLNEWVLTRLKEKSSG